TKPCKRSAGLHVGETRRVRTEVARSARDDLPGRDCVAEDAVLSVVDGDLTRHLHEPALADAVCEMARRADHAVLRGDVDDPAASIADQRLAKHLLHGGPA